MSEMFGFPWKTGASASSTGTAGEILSFFSFENDSNTNTGTDDPLLSWTQQANDFLYRGDVAVIRVWGTTAANTNSKTMKFNFGSTAMLTLTTTTSAAKWEMNIYIGYAGATGTGGTGEPTAFFKYSADGCSATTMVVNSGTTSDSASSPIAVSVTGNSSSASDITVTGYFAQVVRAATEVDLV